MLTSEGTQGNTVYCTYFFLNFVLLLYRTYKRIIFSVLIQ